MGIPEHHACFALEKCADRDRAMVFCFENDVTAAMAAAGRSSAGVAAPALARSGSFGAGPAAARPGSGMARVASSGSAGSAAGSPEDRYDSVAADHAECAVCFDPLCSAPTAVFVRQGGRGHGRVCHHFFHKRCAEEVARSHRECPLCRAAFTGTLDVPNIDRDPDGWFSACDMDGNGELNVREVFEILKAQFPVDYEKLEKDLPKLWRRWDPSNDGEIQKSEFLKPGDGLLAFVRKNFLRSAAARGPPPDIRTDKLAWFGYFDEDHGGTLSQAEVVRGLIKSFRLSEDLLKVEELKATVGAIWCVFDSDGSGEIDQGEFLQRGGLADSVIASFNFHTP